MLARANDYQRWLTRGKRGISMSPKVSERPDTPATVATSTAPKETARDNINSSDVSNPTVYIFQIYKRRQRILQPSLDKRREKYSWMWSNGNKILSAWQNSALPKRNQTDKLCSCSGWLPGQQDWQRNYSRNLTWKTIRSCSRHLSLRLSIYSYP